MNPSAAMARPPRTEAKSAPIARKRNTRSSSARAEIPGSAAEAPERTPQEILNSAVSDHEQVALLAYSYWEERGREGGSPEDDWYRAEREVRGRSIRVSKNP